MEIKIETHSYSRCLNALWLFWALSVMFTGESCYTVTHLHCLRRRIYTSNNMTLSRLCDDRCYFYPAQSKRTLKDEKHTSLLDEITFNMYTCSRVVNNVVVLCCILYKILFFNNFIPFNFIWVIK